MERLVFLAGASSRSGDGARLLAGLLHYLAAQAGLSDAVEASYRADPAGRPLPYDRSDTAAPLDASVRAVQAVLGHHRRALGTTGRLHLLGWSLGGAVLFEAAAGLVDADRGWHGAFGGIVTLSSPLNGCDVDGATGLGEIVAGQAGRELCRRAADPVHRRRTLAARDRLRAAGARVLTLGAADDAVVTPRDSIVIGPGEDALELTMRPTPRLGADFNERQLGHGAILNDPRAWRLVLAAIVGET